MADDLPPIEYRAVWYASKDKIESVTKFIVFDDRGTLAVAPGRLRYAGRKHAFDIADILEVGMVKQRVNWVTYVVTVSIASVYLLFQGFSPIATALIMALAVGLGALIGANTKWVRVSYRGGDGTEEAFFADGSLLGWGGLFGGTTRLFNAIAPRLRAKSAP
jgi:hypothetical protein